MARSRSELIALHPAQVLDLSAAGHELADELVAVLAKVDAGVWQVGCRAVKVVKEAFKSWALCAFRSIILERVLTLSRSLCFVKRSSRSWWPIKPKSIIASRILRYSLRTGNSLARGKKNNFFLFLKKNLKLF